MRVPLVEDMLQGALPSGSSLLVEYDSASQWYAASLTIAAGWLRTGGKISYHAAAQLPEKIRSQLSRLGVDVQNLETTAEFELWDWYSCTLGRKSKEKLAMDSLKIADLSIWWAKHRMGGPPTQDTLRIVDDLSCLSRFNDEKTWVEFMVARVVPSASLMKSTRIIGVIRGIHSDWAYKTLEAAHDGIIDIKLEETGEEARDLMRIRTMRTVPFDRRWHRLNIKENFEIALESGESR